MGHLKSVEIEAVLAPGCLSFCAESRTLFFPVLLVLLSYAPTSVGAGISPAMCVADLWSTWGCTAFIEAGRPKGAGPDI